MKITLPLPPQELNPNKRCHWSAKSKQVRMYRDHACGKCFDACYEHGVESQINDAVVRIVQYHKTKAFMDRDNILASLKPAWDGFTDASLWDDDVDITFLPVEREKDKDNPRVEVTIYRANPTAYETFLKSLTTV